MAARRAAHDFENDPDFRQIVEVVELDPDHLGQGRVHVAGGGEHTGSTPLDGDQETLGLQLLKGGAHRYAADTHLLRKLTLTGQALTGGQFAMGDHVEEFCRDPVGNPVCAIFGYGFGRLARFGQYAFLQAACQSIWPRMVIPDDYPRQSVAELQLAFGINLNGMQ